MSLNPLISVQYMNGFTFSRYLIALKLITVSVAFIRVIETILQSGFKF